MADFFSLIFVVFALHEKDKEIILQYTYGNSGAEHVFLFCKRSPFLLGQEVRVLQFFFNISVAPAEDCDKYYHECLRAIQPYLFADNKKAVEPLVVRHKPPRMKLLKDPCCLLFRGVVLLLLGRGALASEPSDGLRHNDDHANHHKCVCGHEGFVGNKKRAVVDGARVQAAKDRLINDESSRSGSHRYLQSSPDILATCTEIVEDCAQCIDIHVNLHLTSFTSSTLGVELIPHPTTAVVSLTNGTAITAADFSTVEQIQALFADTIDVVNNAFADTPFSFSWDPVNTTVSDNVTWVDAVGDHQGDISAAVGSGDLRQLDVFLGLRLTSDSVLTFGLASFASVQRAGIGEYV